MTLPRLSFQQWARDGRLYAILSAAGFSLKAVFVKLAYGAAHVDALTLLAMRMGIALPLFGWLVWMARGTKEDAQPPLTGMDALRILLLGTVGYYLSSLFDFYGLQTISSGLERLILYLYPTLVLLFQVLWTRRLPAAGTVQAMAICYVGLGIGFVHDLGQAGHGRAVWTGAAWVFASAVTYALYYLGTGAMIKRLGSMRLAGMAGGASSLLVLAHFLLAGHPAAVAALPASVWWNAGLMALLSTALPVYWMALAIARMGATQAAAIGSLGPALTMVASWLLLDEPMSLAQASGLALVMFGVSRLKPRTSAQDTAPRRKLFA